MSIREEIKHYLKKHDIEFQEFKNLNPEYDYRYFIQAFLKDGLVLLIYVRWNYVYEAIVDDGYQAIVELLHFNFDEFQHFMEDYELI